MAAPKSVFGDVANKKAKGLKGHKKAQKEKTTAKRTAAAEKVKVRKTSSAPVAVAVIKVAPVQEEAAGDIEIAPIMKTTSESRSHQGKLHSDSVVADESATITARNEPHANIFTVEKPINETLSEQPFDIIAHRKALEAALYDNMETPRRMLVRCNYVVPIDTEYHPIDVDRIAHEAECSYDYELDEPKGTMKCLDDNRFEIMPNITSLTGDDITAPIDITPSLVLLRLLGMAKDAGETKVGIFNSSVSRAPNSDGAIQCDEIIVNLPRAVGRSRGPVSVGRVSSSSGARVNEKPLEARTMESVENEMRLARDKGSCNASAFVDPAIVSYKTEGQALVAVDRHAHMMSSPANDRSDDFKSLTLLLGLPIVSPGDLSPTSSHHSRTSSPVDTQRANTPLTQYSASPPPELPVWSIPLKVPSYINACSGGLYGPGVQMKAHTGGSCHQPLFPQYYAPTYTQ